MEKEREAGGPKVDVVVDASAEAEEGLAVCSRTPLSTPSSTPCVPLEYPLSAPGVPSPTEASPPSAYADREVAASHPIDRSEETRKNGEGHSLDAPLADAAPGYSR